MAARAKIDQKQKNFTRLLLLNRWLDFEIISQICFLGHLQPNLLKLFRSAKQNCARAKNRKPYKQLFLLYRWMDWETISQECSWDPVSKLFLSNKQDGHQCPKIEKKKKKKKKKTLITSPPKQMDGFWNNFTRILLRRPSSRTAQTVPLWYTRWPPVLKLKEEKKKTKEKLF